MLSRDEFYRPSALTRLRPTPGSITAAAVVVGATLWIGLFSCRHVDYSSSRIAMGDPVGPEAAWEQLLRRFRELADQNGDQAVFYQVHGRNLRC